MRAGRDWRLRRKDRIHRVIDLTSDSRFKQPCDNLKTTPYTGWFSGCHASTSRFTNTVKATARLARDQMPRTAREKGRVIPSIMVGVPDR